MKLKYSNAELQLIVLLEQLHFSEKKMLQERQAQVHISRAASDNSVCHEAQPENLIKFMFFESNFRYMQSK